MTQGHVALVGAGPGHPGLLTLRGLELLRQAEVVVYDKLVPEAMLAHAPAGIERISVEEFGAHHAERYRPVQQRLVDLARTGKRVVRLKGGDPSLFGRVGEEALALAEAGIPFEIVPGVTAALGAAAYAGIPLTHRAHASAVAFVTGHEDPAKPETLLDWDSLARFPGVLVFYMGMSRLEKIVAALVERGKAARTPAAVVQGATTGEQRTVVAPLADLPQAVRAAGLSAPAVVIIGPVVELQASLDWFDKLPLRGRHILVTRPRDQASDLMDRLAALGAAPLLLPAVEVRPPSDWGPIDRVIARIGDYDWLVFTSVNGVSFFLDRLLALGKDLRALGRIRIAAIGPRTAERLAEYHLRADVVPQRYHSEDLAASLAPLLKAADRVLLARADRGRDILREALHAKADLEQIAVYRQVDAIPENHAALDQLRRGDIDVITFTSSNIARALLSRLDETSREHIHLGRTRLASISPITSAAISELGFPVAIEARAATVDALVVAVVEACAAAPS
ncbi:MAG: uroporphyrinogen-III C-methyltransferase [Gemmataceae bacterium]